MSVLACDRAGCKSIMCDRFSDDYGYICTSCFRELIDAGPDIDIAAFMQSQAPALSGPTRSERAEARAEQVFLNC